MSAPALIGLDWGTTACRAYLIDKNGKISDSLASDDGILSIAQDGFEQTFERLLTPWADRAGSLPVIASGMITSRNGWVETPYLTAPAGAADFAGALCPHVTAGGRRLHFVTGLSVENETGVPDVLRGEETEILGHLVRSENPSDTYLVPGTHSKWVSVSQGRLTGFETHMTGEVYAALRGHTILGRLVAHGPFSEAGFDAGAKAGLTAGAGLLHELFAVRTLPLFEKLTPVEAGDYLSGLLIGAETAAGLAARPGLTEIAIIGRDALAVRYQRVLGIAGIRTRRAEQAMVAHGHWQIATLAGLIE